MPPRRLKMARWRRRARRELITARLCVDEAAEIFSRFRDGIAENLAVAWREPSAYRAGAK